MLWGDNNLFSFLVPFVFAHCDTMDGPVIKDAQKALETGNVNCVLIWVQKKDEAEIKKAFEKTLAVRKLSSNPRNLQTCTSLKHLFAFIVLVKANHIWA